MKKCVIDNCHIKNATISYASTTDDFSPLIGGIAGDVLGTVSISRCTIDNLTTPTALTNAYTGGIFGQVNSGNVQIFASSVTNSKLYGSYTCGLVGACLSSLTISGTYFYNCYLYATNYGGASYYITYLFGTRVDMSYLAANSNYYRFCNNNTTTECYNGAKISEYYGIVANTSNQASFTVDKTEYKVSECWKDNGNALPTLKVVEGEN